MYNGEKLIDRPLRWGMVGGGRTGQVGYKHRTGALRDNTAYRMVCGAFDVDADRGRDFGRNLGVAGERLYPDYRTLIGEEAKRDDGVEVVSVATPNFSHYEITKGLLEAGIHVICEKPLFFTVAECDEIARARRGERPDRRRHLRLHRPPARPPDGGDGEEGHARRHPHGRPAPTPTASMPATTPTPPRRRSGGPTPRPRARPSSSATSAPTSTTCRRSSCRTCGSSACSATASRSSSPARLWRTTPMSSPTTTTAPRPALGLLGERRQHGQPALPLRRLEGLARMDRLASRPAHLRGPGRARADPAPRHALPRRGEPRRRPDGRAAHRGSRRQLGEHLSLDRPGDRRQDPRRRGLPRHPPLSGHRGRHRGRALAGELRAFGGRGLDLGGLRQSSAARPTPRSQDDSP